MNRSASFAVKMLLPGPHNETFVGLDKVAAQPGTIKDFGVSLLPDVKRLCLAFRSKSQIACADIYESRLDYIFSSAIDDGFDCFFLNFGPDIIEEDHTEYFRADRIAKQLDDFLAVMQFECSGVKVLEGFISELKASY